MTATRTQKRTPTARSARSTPAASPLRRNEFDDYVAIFRALSEPLRLQMISMFDNEGSCACTVLEGGLPISKSTISYHVKILYQAGLIEIRKSGRFFHYYLRRDVFDYFVPGLLDRLRP